MHDLEDLYFDAKHLAKDFTFLISCGLYLHDTLDFFTYCNYGSKKLELHVWALKHLSILT